MSTDTNRTRPRITGHGIADLERAPGHQPIDALAITAWTRQTHRAREMYRALPITRLHGGAVTVAHCCCWTCRRKP